eukprot:gene18007-5687_t
MALITTTVFILSFIKTFNKPMFSDILKTEVFRYPINAEGYSGQLRSQCKWFLGRMQYELVFDEALMGLSVDGRHNNNNNRQNNKRLKTTTRQNN